MVLISSLTNAAINLGRFPLKAGRNELGMKAKRGRQMTETLSKRSGKHNLRWRPELKWNRAGRERGFP